MANGTNLAEIVNYESQDQVLPTGSILLFSWYGIPLAEYDEKLKIEKVKGNNDEEIAIGTIKRLYEIRETSHSKLPSDLEYQLNLVITEVSQNLSQHCKGEMSFFDIYYNPNEDAIIGFASVDGTKTKDLIRAVNKIDKKRKPKTYAQAEGGQGLLFIMSYAQQIGLVPYQPANPSFDIETALFFRFGLSK